MKGNRLLALLLLISFSVSAQLKTVVRDSLTGKVIPYVAVWSLDNDYSLNSNKKGKIKIEKGHESDSFLLESSAYKSKRILGKAIGETILLSSKASSENTFALKKAASKFLLDDPINFFGGHNYYSCDNNSQLIAQYIPYQPICDNLSFLNKLLVGVKSASESSLLKIRFFEADSIRNPANEMLSNEIVIKVPKLGFVANDNKTDYGVAVDLKPYFIKFPKNGLFIAFELMYVDENISSIKTIDKRNVEIINPFLLTDDNISASIFEFKKGHWQKMTDGTHIAMKLSVTN